jgi:hypothetical protein
MLRSATLIFLVLLALSSPAFSGQELKLRLLPGETVPARMMIEGYISVSGSTVWVIVHPMETKEYWVQPAVTIQDDRLRAMVYIGRPGEVDRGKRFEIMAVADPQQNLREGIILDDWPKGLVRSEIIMVVRQ